MNYLAHIALSGTPSRVSLGNFMGDGVKGAIPLDYPLQIRVGLYLHRFIDYESDTHPTNMDMRVFMRPKYSKYAGVVQDMYHDHFLSKYWEDYHDETLKEFLEEFYRIGEKEIHILPSRQKRFFEGMRKGSWLMNYGDISGMDRAFKGLSSRSTNAAIMLDGAQFLEDNYERLEEGFRLWYPKLKALCEVERVELFKKLSILD